LSKTSPPKQGLMISGESKLRKMDAPTWGEKEILKDDSPAKRSRKPESTRKYEKIEGTLSE